MAPVPFRNTTALLLIDCQYGYRHPTAWGSGASTPNLEANVKKLISTFRQLGEGKADEDSAIIFHVQYRTVWTDSPLHVDHKGPYGAEGQENRGIDFAEYAIPRIKGPDGPRFLRVFDEPPAPSEQNPTPKPHIEGETDTSSNSPSHELFLTKHGHSVFINTPLTSMLKEKGIKTLLIAGMTTDLAVSTAVRMAFNLALVGEWGGKGNMVDADMTSMWTDGAGWYVDGDSSGTQAEPNALAVDMPRIILVGDATRAFGNGGHDAQTVHEVHVESLKSFAEVRRTDEIIDALGTL